MCVSCTFLRTHPWDTNLYIPLQPTASDPSHSTHTYTYTSHAQKYKHPYTPRRNAPVVNSFHLVDERPNGRAEGPDLSSGGKGIDRGCVCESVIERDNLNLCVSVHVDGGNERRVMWRRVIIKEPSAIRCFSASQSVASGG